ncbi:MAG: 50S ribosomal protein L13 [Pseudomonadota bacterium]
MKTFSAKAQAVSHQWYVVDASGQTLGRLASQIAKYLRGKHKPEYTPHVDTGDYMIVINAEKIAVTGKKMSDKIYYSHTGFPGGLKTITLEKLMAKNPIKVMEHAIKGMLPKNPLGRDMFRKLKVYVGSEHPHSAQQPQVINFQDKV